MFEKVKDFFDNLSAEDRQNKSSVDFNQSIDKIRPPKNNDDLEDILLAEKTSDDGGIIAMTGFYYQMMVAVLYLGEVIQGNWDGMFLDHHQDIVLFNNSKQIIKFIQVKTKNKTYAQADKEIVENWIPKLFMTGFNIQNLMDCELKFEIVSNCFFQDQKNFNISSFYPGAKGRSDKKIKELIIKNFNSKVTDSNDRKEVFLNQAFENFNMNHIPYKSLEEKVVRSIPISLGFVSNQLSQNALNNIIAEFFRSCYNPEDASIQLIAGERLNNLRELIEKPLDKSVESAYHKSTEKIFYDYLTNLDKDYSNSKMNSDFIREFKIFLDRFKFDIEESLLSSNLTMRGIINRYLKYNESINVTLEEHEYKKHFSDLLSLLLFLKISIENDLNIEEKNRHILSVNLDSLLFLILGNNDDLRDSLEVIQDFKDLFPRLDDSEKLRIATSENISMIISGIFDKENGSDYTKLKQEELNFSIIPSIGNPELDDISANSIKDVQIRINILYAHHDDLVTINKHRGKYNNLMDMKNKIDEELQLDGIV